jgi:hypothetical protein
MWKKDRTAEAERYKAWCLKYPPRAPGEPAAAAMEVPLAKECTLNATAGAKRVVVEMCCSPDSVIGQPSEAADGTEVIRLTLDCDLRTPEGEQYAEAVCRSNPGCKLWCSLPCVQGSPFYNLNKKHEHARELHELQLADYYHLREVFLRLARIVQSNGGSVAFEWSSRCANWKDKFILDMEKELGLVRQRCSGCQLGLASVVAKTKGEWLAKCWVGVNGLPNFA